MGFETISAPIFIGLSIIFELCPYGIWNSPNKTVFKEFYHLNFVPMGFETSNSIG